MLSKLTNKRSICQGRRSRRSGKGGEQEGGERPPPPRYSRRARSPIGLKNIPIPYLKSLSFWQFVMSNKFAG